MADPEKGPWKEPPQPKKNRILSAVDGTADFVFNLVAAIVMFFIGAIVTLIVLILTTEFSIPLSWPQTIITMVVAMGSAVLGWRSDLVKELLVGLFGN